MKEQDKKADEKIRSLVNEAGLESPSTGFTRSLMARLEVEKKPVVLHRRPLIPVYGWVAVFLFIGGIAGLTYWAQANTTGEATSGSFWQLFNEQVAGFSLSGITVFSLVFLVVALWVQILVLQRRYSRSLEE